MKELTLLKEPGKMSLNPSGKITLSRTVNIGDIKTQKEFEDLFPIIPGNLGKITRRMTAKGFDGSQPLHIWEKDGKLILIDGHHRRLAAIEAGITEIPCYFHHFEGMEEALEYAISVQVERRNLSDAELLIMMKVVDQLKVRGKGAVGERGKSAKRTAEILGTNTSKIEKARIVERYGSEELRKKVAAGELTLNQAYLEARMAREQDGGEKGAGGSAAEECAEGAGDAGTDDAGGGYTGPAAKFLKEAAALLAEKGEKKAAVILVRHFLKEKDRGAFYALLPEGTIKEEEGC